MIKTTSKMFKVTCLHQALALAALGLASGAAWSQEEGNGGRTTASSSSAPTELIFFNSFGLSVLQVYVVQLFTFSVRKNRAPNEYEDAERRRQKMRLSSADGQTGLAGAADESPWSAWAAVGRSNASYAFQPLASSLRGNNAMVGVGYSLKSTTEIGVNLGTDSIALKSGATGRSYDTRGYNVAPYVSVALAPGWTADGMLGFGNATVRANVGGNVTGDSRESRRFAAANVNYFTSAGDWRLVGTGGLQSYTSKLQQFTLSNATVVPASSNTLTQLALSGQASYGSGQWVPFVGLGYAHDLSRPAAQTVAGQTSSNARGTVSAQLGVSFQPSKQVSASLQLTTDRRTEFSSNGLLAMVNVRF